jgi:hypothetical protein
MPTSAENPRAARAAAVEAVEGAASQIRTPKLESELKLRSMPYGAGSLDR